MIDRLSFSAVRAGASALQGKTAALLPPIHLPPIGLPPGKLGGVQGPGAIGFTLNGVLRWLINVHRFAGTPTLSQKTVPQGTRITLEGARFPGTQFPADFVLVVHKTGPFGTPTDISFTLGFHAHVTLESWLAGTQVMQSAVTLGSDVCPLSPSERQNGSS